MLWQSCKTVHCLNRNTVYRLALKSLDTGGNMLNIEYQATIIPPGVYREIEEKNPTNGVNGE
jgi:hypothetical protein